MLLRLRVRVRQLHQARGGLGAAADAEDAAVAALDQGLVVEHLHLDAVLLGRGLRDAGEGGGGEVVRRGVDQVAGAVQLLADRDRAGERALVGGVARLAAEQRGLGERRLAVLGLAVPGVLGVALVGVEGVGAEQDALADRSERAGAVDGQRERGLLRPGERAGGHAGGLAQRLGVVAAAVLAVLAVLVGGLRAEAHRHHERGLEAGRRGQLRQLALGTRGAEGLQDAGQLAVVRLVHGLGARRDDGPLGALGDTDHDRVGPQAGRRGGAESQSSHGGEISLPM